MLSFSNLCVVRLAPEEIILTWFEHNSVTCIGMKTNIPVSLFSNRYFRDRIKYLFEADLLFCTLQLFVIL